MFSKLFYDCFPLVGVAFGKKIPFACLPLIPFFEKGTRHATFFEKGFFFNRVEGTGSSVEGRGNSEQGSVTLITKGQWL